MIHFKFNWYHKRDQPWSSMRHFPSPLSEALLPTSSTWEWHLHCQMYDSTSEIKSRLLLALTALGKLQKVWSDKDITLSTKLCLLNALVYPVLLYGSEIWTIKKNDLQKLVAFEMHCYKQVLNITWKDKIRNEDVLLRISSCKFKPKRILACITESQLSWFVHVCRISNMHLPKRVLMEMVPGTNRQGRPRKRWEDDIIAGSTLLKAYRNAEDRNRWADFCSWSQHPLGHGAKIDRYSSQSNKNNPPKKKKREKKAKSVISCNSSDISPQRCTLPLKCTAVKKNSGTATGNSMLYFYITLNIFAYYLVEKTRNMKLEVSFGQCAI